MPLDADLTALGLPRDRILLVHSSLRAVGPGTTPAALEAALTAATGPERTLVVPAFTARNSTTTRRFRARTAGLTSAEREAEEAAIEPFDRLTTPAQDVGAFAEFIRATAGSVRSGHPQTSFAAVGPEASTLLRGHRLDSHLGEASPLAALYARDAVVLLIGVGFEHCTCLHLAEHRLPDPPVRRPYRCYALRDGRRTLLEFTAPEADDSDFDRLGEDLTQEPFVRAGRVGAARTLAFPMRPAVDFAVGWMIRNRRNVRSV